MPLIAMVLAAAAMPNWASASWLADIRVPVALPFLIIASSRLEPHRLRTVRLFAVIALLLLGTRIWAVTESWREIDQRFAEFRTAARAITPGARLLVLAAKPGEARPFQHLPIVLAGELREFGGFLCEFAHIADLQRHLAVNGIDVGQVDDGEIHMETAVGGKTEDVGNRDAE